MPHKVLFTATKKPRYTQLGSNICTKIGLGNAGQVPNYGQYLPACCDYVVDLELLVERMPGKSKRTMDRLSELRASRQKKKKRHCLGMRDPT